MVKLKLPVSGATVKRVVERAFGCAAALFLLLSALVLLRAESRLYFFERPDLLDKLFAIRSGTGEV